MSLEQNINLKDALGHIRLTDPTLKTLKYIEARQLRKKPTTLDEFLTMVKKDREFCISLRHPDKYKYDCVLDGDILIRNFSNGFVIALENNYHEYFIAVALDKKDFLNRCEENWRAGLSKIHPREDAIAYNVLARFIDQERLKCQIAVRNQDEFTRLFNWDGY